MILNSSKFNNLNKLNRASRGNFAFTLIELLVVIAIIGILSALIVVGMSSTTQKATIAKAQVFSNSLRNSLMGNLVSEWKFDGVTADGSVATANDVLDTWSNINNGDVLLPSAHQPIVKIGSNCVSGSCLQVDGSDAYVNCGNNQVFDMTSVLTLSAWVKMTEDIVALRVFLGKGWTTPNRSYYMGVINNTAQFTIRATGDAMQTDVYSTISLQKNNWYYIVGTADGGKMKLYINGSFNVEGNHTGGIQISNKSISIGRLAVDSASYEFIGLIDDVRIYNAAIPISQIQQTYFAGLNKLFAKDQINIGEYQQRLSGLSNNYAKN
ncbi:MAG: LamG-like jellyroll fold domain-containing protein [Candidatus Paceibacterota bacterium]